MLKHNLPNLAPIVDQLDQVKGLAESLSSGAKSILVKGTAGMGKSSLAFHAAHRVIRETDNYFDFVFQVTAKARAFGALSDILDPLARFLGNNAAASASDDDHKIVLIREEIEGKRGLLILDNAESIDMDLLNTLNALSDDVHLLYTSRTFLETDEVPHLFDIKPLPDQDVAAILGGYVNPLPPDDILKEIFERIGGNPLAAKWVGARLRKGVRPSSLVSRLSSGDEDLFEKLFVDNWEELSSDARAVLQIAACCSSSVGQSLLADARSVRAQTGDEAIAELFSVSLVDIARLGTEVARVNLHPLTRSYALSRLEIETVEQQQILLEELDRAIIEFCTIRTSLSLGRSAYDQVDGEIDTVMARLSALSDATSECDRYEQAPFNFLALTNAVNVLFWRRGMWEERVKFCAAAGRVANSVGMGVAAARQYVNAGIVRYWQSDSRAALEFATCADGCLGDIYAKPIDRAFILRLRALVDHALKKSSQALIHMLTVLDAIRESDQSDTGTQQALKLFSDWPCAGPFGYRSGEVAVLQEIGIMYTDLGEPRDAQYWLGRSIRVAEEIGDDEGKAIALSHRGRCLQECDPLAAQADFAAALSLARAVGRRSTEGRALLGLALGLDAEQQTGRRLLSEAERIFWQLGMTRELEACRAITRRI